MKKLGKYENPKVKKAWKITSIFVCILVFVPCLALATFGILHLAGVTNLKDEHTHVYEINFYDEETSHVYATFYKVRGDKIEYDYKPTKEGYRFRGWDTNHDMFVDIIPRRAYRDINARALWAPLDATTTGGNK